MLLAGLALGVGLTIAGVIWRDATTGAANAAAESVRNAGIAVVGGVTVGALITLVQRAINQDLSARSAAAERRRSIDLVVATHQDLRTIDLGQVDLRGRYLAGKDLRDAELGDADLAGANLRNSRLDGAQMVGADLTGADLSDASLAGTDLTGADLTGADLTGVDLSTVVWDATTRWPAAHPPPAPGPP